MECPNCTFQNMPGLRACVRCRGLLDFSGVDIEPPRARDGRLLRRARLARASAGHRVGDVVSEAVRAFRFPERSQVFWSDLAWSIVPGLAQVRRGHRALGWVILSVWGVVLLAAAALIGSGWSTFLCLVAVSVHCLAVSLLLNAVLTNMPILRRAVTGLLIYGIVLFGLYRPALLAGRQVFRALEVDNLRPSITIANGDVLLYTGMWTRPDGFERGDLVVYDIEHSAGDGAVVRAGLGVERILGIAGDEVETDGKMLWVNGDEQPPDRWPLGGLGTVPRLTVTAAPGEYIIFPSILRWTTQGNVQGVVGRMMGALSHVPQERVRGRVFWRARPWSRAGIPGEETTQ